MRTFCATILAAVAACAVGAADVRDSIPAAKMPEAKHVFSMSCKVTACNGDLTTAEGRAKAIAWWKKNHITKLWLESYRHGERVASERLVELRDAFRAEGLEVCGMITPTMLNDTEPGKKEPRMVVCWSDPKARERMGEECARAARIFDTVILDDFLFSSCGDGCARCRADKAARQLADWGEYKRTLMYEVCERDILPAVKRANPKAHFIIKYPCWYRNYANNGYSPVRQAELFGECWIGTETRDANPEPLQACWIAAWMDSITQGRCGGGWYDALDCRLEKFIEQARYTILGGMKESLVHCYDYLLADDPGRTPFGEKAKSPRACAEAFERESGNLAALAELVRGAERGRFEMLPCGVSRHEFRKDGKSFTIYLNTKGKSVACPEANLTFAPHELRVVGREAAIVECGDNSTPLDFTQYVLPLMGSDSSQDFSNGNTYPAVGRPNGMHLWTLQTGNNGSGWIYAYNDRKVRGIRQTHAPSPWINDHGAWSFMPLVRDAVDEKSRASWFSHKAETFEPHRLKVYLAEDDTTVELSATERAAIARIVYPETDTPYFVVDAFGKDACVKVDAAARRITGESTFFHRGRLPDGFKNRFVLEFDRDFVLAGGEGAAVARIKFAPTKRGEVVTVKIASSYISFDQAKRNLCELGDGDFSRIVEEGRTAWNERLGRIRVEGALDDMRKFYTCLYRTQLFPLALHEYGADGNPVHRNPDTSRIEKGVYYAGTGFWDTFRALFPLLNFVYPDVNAKMTDGLLNCWNECGWLPEWSGPGIINCMIGNNSASVVADACLTPGVASRETAEDLYKALIHGANALKKGNDSCGRAGWELYNRLGYVPRDAKIAFSAARTLEYAYDDWCIWRLGVALGRPKEETDVYLKRSGNWRNVFNPVHRLASGRASDGSFVADFDPFEWGVDFIEGCSWHYTWSVFHDVGALAEAMGGKAAFAKKLDEVFSLPPVFCGYGGQTIHEMREMQVAGFGQYAHGNQPIQHMIYLYDWTDEPHKAQYWAREAMDRLYKPTPDGYCGDEDNGQTSAWFVWSALGMYPVCPASGEYALGTPLFEKASIHFPNGSKLVVAAPGVSAERRYVKRVTLNGKPVHGNFLGSTDLREGGELRFEMVKFAGTGPAKPL